MARGATKMFGLSKVGFGVATVAALCAAASVHGQGVKNGTAGPPQFLRDVAPILDKKGCSTAGCHGKFGGRGDFALSLLTLSPQDDYDPIARGARGRRINLIEPEKSLLLLKATNTMAHAGGQRFKVNSPEYRTIRDWIAAGANYDADKEPSLSSLTVTPPLAVLPKVGAKVPLRVVARFTDGVTRDVTAQANYEANDPSILSVDGAGIVTGKRWGGTAVVVRYLGTVRSASLILPRADKTPYPKVKGNNFIDDYVLANLKKMNVVPSRITTDREFIRRVSLDVCGKLPTPEAVEAFASDTTPDKRAKLIDKLLDSPDYADVRTLRLCDLLRVNPRLLGNNNAGDRGAALFTEWVRDAVASNMPYDQFVRELILGRGSSLRDAPANFYLVDNTPQDRMETLGQAFLGQRMACARCHKHPFDRWTTDNYWNFAAFMGKVAVRNGDIEGEREIFYNPGGRVINDSVTGKARGKVAEPTFLGDAQPVSAQDAAATLASYKPARAPKKVRGVGGSSLGGGQNGVSEGIDVRATEANGDLLQRLADWAVSPQNPYFARATVNRLWGNYLGRGIVNPVDDMRETTPPSVPGLLEALAKDFEANGCDVKRTIRLILNSRTYQTASDPTQANALDNQFFSHFYPRPMLGQVFLDVLNQATGANDRFGDFPEQTKAAQLTLPVGSYFLDTFGRAHREFLAELEPKVEPTLIQTLHILNSPYIDNKVRVNTGTVATLLKAKSSDEETVRALYARTFCRPPSAKEMATALAYLQSAKNRNEAVQDLMWSLISAREFYFVS